MSAPTVSISVYRELLDIWKREVSELTRERLSLLRQCTATPLSADTARRIALAHGKIVARYGTGREITQTSVDRSVYISVKEDLAQTLELIRADNAKLEGLIKHKHNHSKVRPAKPLQTQRLKMQSSGQVMPRRRGEGQRRRKEMVYWDSDSDSVEEWGFQQNMAHTHAGLSDSDSSDSDSGNEEPEEPEEPEDTCSDTGLGLNVEPEEPHHHKKPVTKPETKPVTKPETKSKAASTSAFLKPRPPPEGIVERAFPVGVKGHLTDHLIRFYILVTGYSVPLVPGYLPEFDKNGVAGTVGLDGESEHIDILSFMAPRSGAFEKRHVLICLTSSSCENLIARLLALQARDTKNSIRFY